MKPADLRPGQRIAHTVPKMLGAVTVVSEPWANEEDDLGLARVFVDVEVFDRSLQWDPQCLPAGTGASRVQWLGSTPTLRYRLVFMPDADVAVCNG